MMTFLKMVGIHDGAIRTKIYCKYDRIEISNENTMFLRKGHSMALRRMSPHVSGSRKSMMADIKPEVHVTALVDMIESNFQV
jgi:hypothetical protein